MQIKFVNKTGVTFCDGFSTHFPQDNSTMEMYADERHRGIDTRQLPRWKRRCLSMPSKASDIELL